MVVSRVSIINIAWITLFSFTVRLIKLRSTGKSYNAITILKFDVTAGR